MNTSILNKWHCIEIFSIFNVIYAAPTNVSVFISIFGGAFGQRRGIGQGEYHGTFIVGRHLLQEALGEFTSYTGGTWCREWAGVR